MSVNSIRSVPTAPALPPTDAEQAAQADAQERVLAKDGKQASAEKAVATKSEKVEVALKGQQSAIDSVAAVKGVAEGKALVEALVQSGVAPAPETVEAKNSALQIFEALLPQLGKPSGALAQDFTARAVDAPLRAMPIELEREDAWHELSSAVAASTPDAPAADRIATLLQKLAPIAPALEPQTLKSAPQQWARYTKIVESFWRHDKTALLQPAQPPTPAMIASLAAMKPHMEALAAVMKSSYAPAIKGARTAQAASDVPVLPDSLTVEAENALGLRSLSEAGLAVAALVKTPDKLAAFKRAMQAELDGKSCEEAPGLRALAKTVVPHVQSFQGFDTSKGDIDALVWMVMTECAKLEESIMRDQMKEMQKQNQQKKAQREKLATLREGRARLDSQMQQEFHMLQATGEVHGTITFDQYKAWRQVAWGDGMLGEDGKFVGPKPTLTPRPPIPGWLKNGKLEEQKGSGDASVQKYGLDPDVEGLLKGIYEKFPAEGRGEFSSWLSKFCPGLQDVSKLKGEAAIKAIKANLEKIAQALGDKNKITPTPPASTGTTSLEDAKNMARGIALKQALGIPLSFTDNQNLQKLLDGLGPDAAEFNFWRDNQLSQELKNKATELKTALNYCRDRVCQGWEADRDRDVHGMKIVDGQVMFDVYDDGDAGTRNEYRGWMSYEQLMHDRAGYAAADSSAKQPAIINEVIAMLRAGGVTPTFDEAGTTALADNLAQGTPEGLPRATEAEKPKPIDQESINLDAGEAKKQLQEAIDAYGEILGMGKNPDGSFYGKLSDVGQHYFDKLVAAGKATKGKSPDEVRKEEAEKAKAEAELKAFVEGGEAGAPPSFAMRLNHTGSIAELEVAEQTAKDQLDSMGDMSALESMRMQQMMERRSKALEMLTNIMKKMAQLSDSITANCK